MGILVLRPMRSDEDGKPEVGEGALKLGVRSSDVEIKDGYVQPTQGVSVVTNVEALRKLPRFLIPFKQLRHPLVLDHTKSESTLFCYTASDFEPFKLGKPISRELTVVAKDVVGAGCIVPTTKQNITQFQRTIASTRESWKDFGWENAVAQISELNDD